MAGHGAAVESGRPGHGEHHLLVQGLEQPADAVGQAVQREVRHQRAQELDGQAHPLRRAGGVVGELLRAGGGQGGGVLRRRRDDPGGGARPGDGPHGLPHGGPARGDGGEGQGSNQWAVISDMKFTQAAGRLAVIQRNRGAAAAVCTGHSGMKCEIWIESPRFIPAMCTGSETFAQKQ